MKLSDLMKDLFVASNEVEDGVRHVIMQSRTVSDLFQVTLVVPDWVEIETDANQNVIGDTIN